MAKATGVSTKTISFVYDFTVNTGAISTIQMGVWIPAGSVVQFGVAQVVTALVGATATIAIGWTGNTGALVAATAVASWSDDAVLEGVDLIVAMVKVTAIQQLAVTIATAELTAGRFFYTCQYIEYSEV